ncbi:hypothetical protein DFH06DRAFT_1149948 [Mycena polygramma]|nr:hypothetical protein DFH06DRAFT_1149948 [Mycena polygramma]
MFPAIVASQFYSNLLSRLRSLPFPLVAEIEFGREFQPVVLSTVNRCEHYSFVHVQGGPVFEPLVVGGIADVHDGGHGFVTLELGVPTHSMQDLDVLFWNQVASLDGVLAGMYSSHAGALIREFVRWCHGPFVSVANADNHRIFVEVPPCVPVVRNTPSRTLNGLSSSSSDSLHSIASSSTLCSVEDDSASATAFALGDVLVISVQLHCRDFPRPSRCTAREIVRAFFPSVQPFEIVRDQWNRDYQSRLSTSRSAFVALRPLPGFMLPAPAVVVAAVSPVVAHVPLRPPTRLDQIASAVVHDAAGPEQHVSDDSVDAEDCTDLDCPALMPVPNLCTESLLPPQGDDSDYPVWAEEVVQEGPGDTTAHLDGHAASPLGDTSLAQVKIYNMWLNQIMALEQLHDLEENRDGLPYSSFTRRAVIEMAGQQEEEWATSTSAAFANNRPSKPTWRCAPLADVHYLIAALHSTVLSDSSSSISVPISSWYSPCDRRIFFVPLPPNLHFAIGVLHFHAGIFPLWSVAFPPLIRRSTHKSYFKFFLRTPMNFKRFNWNDLQCWEIRLEHGGGTAEIYTRIP